MEQWWTSIVDDLSSPQALTLFWAAVRVGLGIVLGRLAVNGMARLDDSQREMILRRFPLRPRGIG